MHARPYGRRTFGTGPKCNRRSHTSARASRSRDTARISILFFARLNGGGERGMPLAANRHRVADLPIHFDLSDADTMSPEFKLSFKSRAVIVARFFETGDARVPAGDCESASLTISVGADGVSVLINKLL
jgi:cytochrome c-type biogenesis protein CcmH